MSHGSKRPATHTKFFSLRVPPQLADDVRRMAARESRTASDVVRQLLTSGLAYERERQADVRRQR
jgi:Arc/MetJ-type ribon-helix-helix transcriptional regulator